MAYQQPRRRFTLRGGILVALVLAATSANANGVAQEASSPVAVATASATLESPSSEQIEKDLQSLSWPQFRSVVEAVPKLKADVDAYGPLGWAYVEANYAHYRWKKLVDKLNAEEKLHLAHLIANARRPPN